MNADSWPNAVKDIDIVLHVASPFPMGEPEDEQLVIKPAVEGTLNVMKACVGTKVKRVVVTSSCYAVFGEAMEPKLYTESDWGDLSICKSAYCKSKILAEKAAWDFVEEKKKNNEACYELAVVNPSLVFGPILSKVYGTSCEYFLQTFKNKTEPVPGMALPCCDVRDVALVVNRVKL